MLHHDGQEADDDLGAGPDQDLALAAFLRIVDAFQRVGEDVHAHHGACRGAGEDAREPTGGAGPGMSRTRKKPKWTRLLSEAEPWTPPPHGFINTDILTIMCLKHLGEKNPVHQRQIQ